MYVAIKSYAKSPKTSSTFDGFIDCTLEQFSSFFYISRCCCHINTTGAFSKELAVFEQQ
jgi:hypothetical protein